MQLESQNLSNYLRLEKKRYANLVSREPRKFKTLHKDGIVVLRYSVDCYNYIRALGFPRTFDLERSIQFHASKF